MNREAASRQINGFESNNEARATPDQNASNDPSHGPASRRENENKNGTEVDEGVLPSPHVARSDPLAALAETAKNYARAARATQRAYDADWRHFSSWLRRQGFSQLPPDPQTVGLYLAACVDGAGHGAEPTSVATLERRLSGICWHYRQLGYPLCRAVEDGETGTNSVIFGARL